MVNTWKLHITIGCLTTTTIVATKYLSYKHTTVLENMCGNIEGLQDETVKAVLYDMTILQLIATVLGHTRQDHVSQSHQVLHHKLPSLLSRPQSD